jgi:hypothetical protein
VIHLGEPVDNSKDHGAAFHLGKTFDEVHGYVTPNRCGHVQGLQKTNMVEVLGLVALTDDTTLDELTHELGGAGL